MRALLGRTLVKVLTFAGLLGSALSVKGCALSFDDYPIGDLCAASADAGFQPSTAPDPALRGCDAGVPANESAGAAGMDGVE